MALEHRFTHEITEDEAFSAALRRHVRCPLEGYPSLAHCVHCRAGPYDPTLLQEHFTTCTKKPGINVSTTHTTVKQKIRELCTVGGVQVSDVEEVYRSVRCGCGSEFTQAAFQQHKRDAQCRAAADESKLHLVQADGKACFDGRWWVWDNTSPNPMGPSNSTKPLATLAKGVRRDKTRRYGEKAAQDGADFGVVNIMLHGHIDDASREELKKISAHTGISVEIIEAELQRAVEAGASQAQVRSEKKMGLNPGRRDGTNPSRRAPAPLRAAAAAVANPPPSATVQLSPARPTAAATPPPPATMRKPPAPAPQPPASAAAPQPAAPPPAPAAQPPASTITAQPAETAPWRITWPNLHLGRRAWACATVVYPWLGPIASVVAGADVRGGPAAHAQWLATTPPIPVAAPAAPRAWTPSWATNCLDRVAPWTPCWAKSGLKRAARARGTLACLTGAAQPIEPTPIALPALVAVVAVILFIVCWPSTAWNCFAGVLSRIGTAFYLLPWKHFFAMLLVYSAAKSMRGRGTVRRMFSYVAAAIQLLLALHAGYTLLRDAWLLVAADVLYLAWSFLTGLVTTTLGTGSSLVTSTASSLWDAADACLFVEIQQMLPAAPLLRTAQIPSPFLNSSSWSPSNVSHVLQNTTLMTVKTVKVTVFRYWITCLPAAFKTTVATIAGAFVSWVATWLSPRLHGTEHEFYGAAPPMRGAI